jgi:hypothetical protein
MAEEKSISGQHEDLDSLLEDTIVTGHENLSKTSE